MAHSENSDDLKRSVDEASASLSVRILHDSPKFVKAISTIQRRDREKLKPSRSDLSRQMKIAIDEHKDRQWAPSLFSMPFQVPYETIAYIVERYPESLLMQSKLAKRSPLHYACLRSYPTRSIVAIARCQPEQLSQVDARGKHPINYLNKESALASTLSTLRAIDSLVFTRRNAHGDLPINVACRERWSVEVIKIMAADLSLESAFYNPLFDAMRGYQDEEFEERIVQLLRIRPWLARVSDKVLRKYPLHFALDSGIESLPVLHELVECYPQALRERDIYGERPYEIVVRAKLSDDVLLLIILRYFEAVMANKVMLIFNVIVSTRSIRVIKRILDAYPCCLEDRGFGGKCLLHLLLVSWSTYKSVYRFELLQLMVDLAPKILLERDERGCTPLSYACMHKVGQREFEYLFRYPNVASFVDVSGMLPLHHLLSNARDANEEDVLFIVKRLLDVHPQAISTCDCMGKLPLHWACESGAPIRAIRFILHRYKDGSSVVDSVGMPALLYLARHVEMYNVPDVVQLMHTAEQSHYLAKVLHPIGFIRLCEQNESTFNFLLDWCDTRPIAFLSEYSTDEDSCVSQVLKTWSDDVQCLRLVERFLEVDETLATMSDRDGSSPLELAIRRYCTSNRVAASPDSPGSQEEDNNYDDVVDHDGDDSSLASSIDSDDCSSTLHVDAQMDEHCFSLESSESSDASRILTTTDDADEDSFSPPLLLAEPQDSLLNLEMVKRLVARIPDEEFDEDFLPSKHQWVSINNNPLRLAVSLRGCSMELVHALIQALPSCYVAQVDMCGRNLLHTACATLEPRSQLAQALFQELTTITATGSDASCLHSDALDMWGNSPLFYAASNPYISLDTLWYMTQRSLTLFPLQGSHRQEQ